MGTSRSTFLLVSLVGVLLVVLAVLQYRWIGELSRAEEERMRDDLRRSARRFSGDFDREVGELLWVLLPSADSRLRDQGRTGIQVELWRARARHPGILRDVWSFTRGGPDGLRAERLDESTGEWVAEETWPEALDVAARLDERTWRNIGFPLLADVPALVAPRFAPRDLPGRRGRPGLVGVYVARLDETVLTGQVLPELAERHFGDGSFDLTVVDRDGVPLFRSNPEGPVVAPDESDQRVDLFRPEGIIERRPPRDGQAPPGGRPPQPRERFERLPWRPQGPGAWQLLARHTSGSLAAAVERARWRNLAVSGGVLVLLGVAAGLLVAATRRAEWLARQQMEFVAGVTHELHTPLAAICSAGSNLADGVVAEPERVRSYGDMIRSEGHRLSHTVDQVLDFAGIQSGARAYEMEPVDVSSIVAGVLAQNALVLHESGLAVERELAESLPAVQADPGALRRALDNLVGNVVRHAAEGGRIAVKTRLAEGGRAVEVRVADQGLGIPPGERKRLFEPFVRGRATSRGTGLGLSIVRHVAEAHGGTVGIESPDRGGACFVLRLPVGGPGRTA